MGWLSYRIILEIDLLIIPCLVSYHFVRCKMPSRFLIVSDLLQHSVSMGMYLKEKVMGREEKSRNFSAASRISIPTFPRSISQVGHSEVWIESSPGEGIVKFMTLLNKLHLIISVKSKDTLRELPFRVRSCAGYESLESSHLEREGEDVFACKLHIPKEREPIYRFPSPSLGESTPRRLSILLGENIRFLSPLN